MLELQQKLKRKTRKETSAKPAKDVDPDPVERHPESSLHGETLLTHGGRLPVLALHPEQVRSLAVVVPGPALQGLGVDGDLRNPDRLGKIVLVNGFCICTWW